MSGRARLIPDRVLPPVFRQAHVGEWNTRVFIEQSFDPNRPAAAGVDQGEEMAADKQDDPAALVVRLVLTRPQGAFVGQDGRIAEAAIPEAGVVGAAIADAVQAAQPGEKDFVHEAKIGGDLLLELGGDTFAEGEQAAHAHQLGEHPERQLLVVVAVAFKEVLAEGLLAAIGLDQQSGAPLQVVLNLELWEVAGLQIAKGAVGVGKMEDETRADCDLDALNHVEHQHAEAAVEAVAIPDLGQVGAFAVAIRLGEAKGVQVAGEAVIVDDLKPTDEQGPIRHQATLKQTVGLGFERKGLFAVFHGGAVNQHRGMRA